MSRPLTVTVLDPEGGSATFPLSDYYIGDLVSIFSEAQTTASLIIDFAPSQKKEEEDE